MTRSVKKVARIHSKLCVTCIICIHMPSGAGGNRAVTGQEISSIDASDFLRLASGFRFCSGSNFAFLHWLKTTPSIWCCAMDSRDSAAKIRELGNVLGTFRSRGPRVSGHELLAGGKRGRAAAWQTARRTTSECRSVVEHATTTTTISHLDNDDQDDYSVEYRRHDRITGETHWCLGHGLNTDHLVPTIRSLFVISNGRVSGQRQPSSTDEQLQPRVAIGTRERP